MLLCSMPAAIASPALTDIAKGNPALSASLVVLTSLLAPITIPLLFWLIDANQLSINPWWLFKDLTLIILLPLIIAHIVKSRAGLVILKYNHFITTTNILILTVMVFAVIGSQREIILNDFLRILWQVVALYAVFILLHIIGYYIGFKRTMKDKIALTVVSAYRNNGLAIVLAAVYFDPSILILMVLTELPWNTLIIPFRKIAISKLAKI